MRYSAVLLLATLASLGVAADFKSGQSARMTIGQSTFTAQDPASPTSTMLGAAGAVAYAGDTLFIGDANRLGATPLNYRVMVYRNISTKFPKPGDNLAVGPRCPVCTADPSAPRAADVVLGQSDFTSNTPAISQSGMALPLGIASDGKIVAVADTQYNRVLIWNSIPTTNGAPADIVLGQQDFNSSQVAIPPTQSSLRGPQGLWIQNGRLFVADTLNHRVLVWNSIPAANNAPADIALGVPNFSATPDSTLGGPSETPTASNLLNPVSVTSDGTRVYVADLGHNRVVIWNDINALSTNKPFDVVVGQPDATSMVANNSSKLCTSSGNDSNGNPIYPVRCAGTMDFPRFALSDGTRLYIADGGNDRVLVWNQIPNASGVAADLVLGQPDMVSDINSDQEDFFNPNLVRSAPNTIRTPTSMAWDGTNLYVADPYDRRVLVFTPGAANVPNDGVRNAASLAIYAVGGVTFTGTPATGETVKLTITTSEKNPDGSAKASNDYSYKVVKDDTLGTIINALVAAINAGAGDPYVLASANVTAGAIQLTARQSGDAGNNITVSKTTDSTSALTVTASNPSGGKDAAKLAPGALVTILGQDLCDCDSAAASDDTNLPRELANTQVYFDGIAAPLMYVSKTQINAQVPYEVSDATAVNSWVRTTKQNGEVVFTTAVAVPMAGENPGIFAFGGPDPRVAVAYHAYGNATAVIQIDGTVTAGDVATIKIGDNSYSYTVTSTDTLATIRDALISLINGNQNEKVTASAAAAFTRIILIAKSPGTSGNGIAVSVSVSSGAKLLLTALQAQTCCASQAAGSLITPDNPAVPGETIIIYATGLGIPNTDAAKAGAKTGIGYSGPVSNDPTESVSSLIAGKTANVLSAGLKPNTVGLSEVWLQLNSDLPDNPFTQMTIAQNVYVSNIATIPVKNPPK